jgi:hypothetical protein
LTPQTNGELSHALLVTRAAWARCAAEVDMVADCQENGAAGNAGHE